MHFNFGPHKVQKVIRCVRIPGASHDITARPSNLIGRVAHVLNNCRLKAGSFACD